MSAKKSVTVTFEPYGIKSEFGKGTLLLETLKSAGLNVRSDCGGKGICGKCKVIIKDPSNVSSACETERERLSSSELKSGYRLACCSRVNNDATILVPEESRAVSRKFLVEGTEKPVVLDPAVRKFYAVMKKPTLADVVSDVQRLLIFLKDTYGLEIARIDLGLTKMLPDILRNANWRVTVAVWNNTEIISVEPGDTTEEAYGIAVDIGTSKILGYLSNLINGNLVCTGSLENPQIIHGEDVISRISFASRDKASLGKMQDLAVKGVNTILLQVCKESGCEPKHIYEMTVAGNTAMHHLFLGIQPRYLGMSPYVPVVSDAIDVKAKDLSLRLNPNANIHILPIIAGFVGADAVADIIATELYKSRELSLIIDIGTNTEIVLGDNREMIACSCASGPAFEGGHIKSGMKAVAGAIEKLHINPHTCGVKYQTVGDAAPIGICGSGIIDAVADLLKCRLIDRSGVFTKRSPTRRLRTRNGEKEFVLVSQKEGATHDITITQKDIEQVQLAKAAIYSGCSILMKTKRVLSRNIKNLFLAGAFGNYINISNAKLIGMLPDIPTKCITFVGNAAGAGARMALISKKHRHTASAIRQKVQYLELASEPSFHTEFTTAMFFPNKNSKTCLSDA